MEKRRESIAMGTDNLVFLEVIEWFDDTGQELVHRIPEKGSGEIKYGAQLTVRESQTAVFFYRGKAIEVFGPGRHTLKTANIPILTKLISIPWGMTSPLRAEVYLLNMKIFTDLKWGTRDPVAFRDAELGLVRLRAHGVFNLQVVQPLLFINSLVGTRGIFTTEEIAGYLNRVIVSRFNDYMGESLDSLLNLPARYDEFSEGLGRRLQADFDRFGLAMTHLYINSITPPPEVQKAIDDRSRMGVFTDMDRLMKMKAAMAMEKASEAAQEGGGGGDGDKPRADDAGHVRPVFRRRPSGGRVGTARQRRVPGVRRADSPQLPILPPVRSPAGRFPTLRIVRQKPGPQRKVLLALRQAGDERPGGVDLRQLRQRKPARRPILQPVR
jgi:membrane protease subunit (stomatin/prohibitin family)